MTTRTLPDDLTLRHGNHTAPEDGMCVMEAVAWLAGEPHSDTPLCVAPTVRAFLIRINDSTRDDAARTALLRPYLLRVIGTAPSSDEVERRRTYLLADWAVRTIAPLALEARGWTGRAATLRALPEIVDRETALAGHDAVPARHRVDANATAASYAAAFYAAAAASYAAAGGGASYAFGGGGASYAAAAADAAVYAAVYADAAAEGASRDAFLAEHVPPVLERLLAIR